MTIAVTNRSVTDRFFFWDSNLYQKHIEDSFSSSISLLLLQPSLTVIDQCYTFFFIHLPIFTMSTTRLTIFNDPPIPSPLYPSYLKNCQNHTHRSISIKLFFYSQTSKSVIVSSLADFPHIYAFPRFQSDKWLNYHRPARTLNFQRR